MLCLGAGNMVSAIVPSFKTIIPALSFTAFTPTKVRAEALMEKVGGNHLDKLSDLEDYDVILLGFKPQQFQETARRLKIKLRQNISLSHFWQELVLIPFKVIWEHLKSFV